jgi:hypothetical protein|eukprot:TRINITY_DN194_c0_g4_i1.p2 TRINITY_DN194_c0_g4~~TRINITY_DN194_c0_g4_i1.p2  ORF type:complete len:105 (+),score=31.18 TRINITY_DN194_c0_g4_i1:155-469(+)
MLLLRVKHQILVAAASQGCQQCKVLELLSRLSTELVPAEALVKVADKVLVRDWSKVDSGKELLLAGSMEVDKVADKAQGRSFQVADLWNLGTEDSGKELALADL